MELDMDERFAIRLRREVLRAPERLGDAIELDWQAMKLRVIVTGAAGFIGSNLSEKLLSLGHEVVGLDNFIRGTRSNLQSVNEHENFQFLERDLCEITALDDVEGDALVHLASYKIPRYTDALDTLGFNALMVKNVVDHCLKHKLKLIFASTSDVYGKNPSVPFHEGSDLVMGPVTVKRWAYAVSKIFAEQYILAAHAKHGLSFTVARLFGSYGPRQNPTWWGGPQSVFIEGALNRSPIEIHGTGNQTRTFTYVDDTVDGILRCIVDQKACNEIFNVGSEICSEITILQLATEIWRLINPADGEPLLKFIPYSSFGNYEDVMRRVPDITKIKSMLGYKPKIGLREGLIKTIDWRKTATAQNS
jgi:UDP-glucose 4-epimerase